MILKYEDLIRHTIYRISGDEYEEWAGMEFIITEFIETPETKFVRVEPINDHKFKDTFETLYANSAIASECDFIEIGNKETNPEYFL